MNKFFIIGLLLLVCCGMSSALTGTNYHADSYSCTGNFSLTNTAAKAFDSNLTSYAQCLSTCECYFNYTNPPSPYSDTVIWDANISGTLNGEILTPANYCIISSTTTLQLYAKWNLSDSTNMSFMCYDYVDSNWTTLHDGGFGSTNLYYEYLYYNDVAPTVTISLPADGYTKECNDDGTYDQIPVVFSVTDNTDNEFDCTLNINGVNQSTNSSVSNNTDTIMYGRIQSGNNSIYVRCEDESSYGDSTTRYVTGEPCTCTEDWSDALIEFFIIMAICFAVIGGYFISSKKYNSQALRWLMYLGCAAMGLWFLLQIVIGGQC